MTKNWSQVALACSGLKQGFSSWSVTEVRSRGWEYRILATRPVVSDKALALRLCRKRIPAKTESSETSKEFIRRKKRSTVCVDRHTGGLRERVVPLWQLESLLWGISSGFPLTNHFDLPGSEPIFGVSQDFPMYARTSLSQDGVYRRGLWVGLTTWRHSPFDLQGAFLHMCSWGGLLTLRMRNMWSLIFYLGRAQPSLSVVLLFPSWSISPQGTNSNCLPWGPIYLLPQNQGQNRGVIWIPSFTQH